MKILQSTLIRLDNLWKMKSQYVMILHCQPPKAPPCGFHFYIQIFPPLRKPNLMKFLAGPEIGGGNILNDTCAEVKVSEILIRRDKDTIYIYQITKNGTRNARRRMRS